MDVFSNREIAALIWLTLFSIFILFGKSKTFSAKQLILSAMNIKIIFYLEFLAIYLMIICYLISKLISFELPEVKTAIQWYIFAGIPVVSASSFLHGNYRPLKSLILNVLTAILLLEYLISKYTYSLIAEIVILPTVFALGLGAALSSKKDGSQSIARFCNTALILFILVSIWHSSSLFLKDDITRYEVIKDLSLPLLFTFFTIPYFFGVYVIIAYENAFQKLNLIEDERVRSYAKKRTYSRIGLHLSTLNRFALETQQNPPNNEQDVEAIIDDAHHKRNLLRFPPSVAPNLGWSPYLASAFLKKLGFKAGEYKLFDEEWSSVSNVKVLKGDLFDNSMFYCVRGNETTANEIYVKFQVSCKSKFPDHFDFYREICEKLLDKAVPRTQHKDEVLQILNTPNSQVETSNHSIEFKKTVVKLTNLDIETFTFKISKNPF